MIDFQQIKNEVSVFDVAHLYGVETNHAGQCKCCFHNEKTASMKLYDDHFYCFGCGKAGDAIELVAGIFDLSKYDAARKIASDFGISEEYNTQKVAEHQSKLEEAKKWKDTERKVYRLISDKMSELRKNKEIYAPSAPGEPLHPLFIEALQKMQDFEYYVDIFTFESDERKKTFIEDNKGLIAELEANKSINNNGAIYDIINNQIYEFANTPALWQSFLKTSARMYKYDLDSQILIHAQNPEATACATIDLWNKEFGRYIKPDIGAKGIALLDDNNKLKYVFDISETVKSDTGKTFKEPNIWSYSEKIHENAVLKSLKGSYDTINNDLPSVIIEAVHKLVEDYNSDETLKNDVIATLKETELYQENPKYAEICFNEIIHYSIAYTVFTRLGLNLAPYFEDKYIFDYLKEIQSEKAIITIGTITTDLSSTLLRQIERSVKAFDKERKIEHELELQSSERLYDIGRDNSTRVETREIQQSETSILERAEENHIQSTEIVGETELSPRDDRANSTADVGNNNDEIARAEPRSEQRNEPDRVGSSNDNSASDSGRNDNVGSDLSLNNEEKEEIEEYLQQTFPTLETQLETIRNSREDEVLVKIGYSESRAFYYVQNGEFIERNNDLSFAITNNLLGYLDDKQSSQPGYDKTDFTINTVIDGIDYEYKGRYDIGSENGDLVTHIKNFYEYSLESAKDDELEDIEYGLNVFVPFLEKNRTLSENELAVFNDIKSEFDVWFTPEQEQTENSKYNYNIGDIVYLDDNETEYIITNINEYGIETRNPAHLYPIFRKESFENFEQLLDRWERNKETLTFREVSSTEQNNELDEVKTIPIKQVGAFYEVQGDDANIVAETLGLTLTTRQNVPLVGFPEHLLEQNEKALQNVNIKLENIEQEKPLSNYHITDLALAEEKPSVKLENNLEAIRVIKSREAITAEKQAVLSKYVGWGGLADVFDENKTNYYAQREELKSLLTADEYSRARESTLTAFYTSPTIISAMYKAIERLGFKEGKILEPSCGVGNFFGMLPESMKNSSLAGVELDSISGQIAKALYPNANIEITGFEKTSYNENSFDVVVGNIPFGEFKVADRKYDKNHFFIHDYFIAKSLDLVRPGGVVAVITSKGTLEKKNSSVRRYIAERAELLGAIRLPNNAFSKNAGTTVTSDILFFQKRENPIEIEHDYDENSWVHLGLTEDNIPINAYFEANPQMVLGKIELTSGRFGQEVTCSPLPDVELSELLEKAILNINGVIDKKAIDIEEDNIKVNIKADPEVKNFSYVIKNDNVYYKENQIMNYCDLSAKTKERVKGMVELRDITNKLIDMQLNGDTDEEIKDKQAELSEAYDRFSKKHGLINSSANKSAFNADSSYYLLCSLEVLDEKNQFKRKSDIFTKRTINARTNIQSVKNANEALAVSIGERAYIDLPFMAELSGLSQEQIIHDLTGVIFKDPENGDYIMADEYLSGNIREKLELAKNAAKEDETLNINVTELEKALPVWLDASEIFVQLGSVWIKPKYISEFMSELLEFSRWEERNFKVEYFDYNGQWWIRGSRMSTASTLATVTYGTSRMSAIDIISRTLNNTDVKVYDSIEVNGKPKSVLNRKETVLAEQKQALIKEKFREWIWSDPNRRNDLVTTYNTKYNSIRPREYDGSYITFAGINPNIEFYKHQKDAIARGIYGGNALFAHEVGAGKTFEVIATAMESKRLGLANKSIIAVPNHLTEQWANEWLTLYPAANILVTTKKDFQKENRKKFCARIATGDYDGIIIGHSQFEKIPISNARQARYINDEIENIERGIRELKSKKGIDTSVKKIEATKKNLKAKLQKLLSAKEKDDVLEFEQLGVDRIYVDESHNYKNLFTSTKLRNVSGISQTESQKSADMLMKCRYMNEKGGKIVFATGTPVSNTMVELFTIQRYLQSDLLEAMNLTHFDNWVGMFGETTTSIELAPEGTGYRAKTRLAKFNNLPELMAMFKEVADIKTADELNLPVPKAEYLTVVAKPTDTQKDMIAELAERAAAINSGGVNPKTDNMLKVTSDGRKIGLDQRLIDPSIPDNPNSKVNKCVQNIYDIWEQNKEQKLTQLIFCDFSTPKKIPISQNENGVWEMDKEAMLSNFNIYDDMKVKLLNMGIPLNEIAFIHDYNTDEQKDALFAKVRNGQVRVLFGSTQKMGTGTNVQTKLIALHDLDCPWRPSDLTQRSGRGVRQGNQNDEIKIFRYVTESTFDSYLYQMLEKKQTFISQIMTSKQPVRSCEDIDESVLSYAEIKALCAGNPLIREKMNLDVEVQKLNMIKTEYQSQRYRIEDKVKIFIPKEIEKINSIIDGLKSDIKTAEKHPQPTEGISPMMINGKVYTDKEAAGTELIKACSLSELKYMEKEIGSYRGFKMKLSYNAYEETFKLTLCGNNSYTIDLGSSIHGNIQRIDNVITLLPGKIKRNEEKLENCEKELINLKKELDKPFEFQEALAEKTERLNTLNALLKLSERENDTNVEIEKEDDISQSNDEKNSSLLGKLEEKNQVAESSRMVTSSKSSRDER